jgi:hypothetical protein
MPFSTEDFLESVAQSLKAAPREPSYSPGDDGYLERPSVTSSGLPMEHEKEKKCRISCRHRDCRTFRRAHGEALPAEKPRRPTALPYNSIVLIFFLHKKLASIQDAADACVTMFELYDSNKETFWIRDCITTRSYYRSAGRRFWAFEALLSEMRRKNAYFGHIDMPECLEFSDAVAVSGLSDGQIPSEQLFDWDRRAEDLRREARSNSEVQVEEDNYPEPPEVGFKSGWSFANANAEGEGTATEDEEIAPDEIVDENHGTKRSRSQSSNSPDGEHRNRRAFMTRHWLT